jgi:CRISPR-associated protein (TIGR03986 family)
VNAKKQIRVKFTNTKGKEVEMAVPDAELSASLKLEAVEKLNGRKVEFEEVGGQPKKVRPVGEPFAAAPAPPPVRPSQQQRGPQQRPPAVRGAFHNPYNFVPALPRDRVTGELGDHEPIGHHVLHPDRYTGVIRVKMTVKTPLLLPDAARMTEYDRDNQQLGIKKDHKSFPIRIDAEGKPYIPPTSIKGMLRAAYEAVTNSRLAVFAGHEDRLGRRMGSDEGLGLVPCRIEGDRIRLLPGTSAISANRPTGPMYAAWLPFDLLRQLRSQSALPAHRDAVSCWIELWERTPWHRHKKQFEPHKRFQYWKVLRLGQRGQAGPRPNPSPAVSQQQGRNHHAPVFNVPLREIDGYACMTDYNFDRKYNERVFFEDATGATLPRLPEHGALWSNLIRDYRTNQDLLMGRNRPSALQSAGWSRHMTDNEELQLSDSSLAYALIEPSGNTWRVRELFPVCISRRLFESSPLSLLPESLRPATSRQQLSPADRVFGWVNRRGKGAYKGNVRIGPVTCITPNEQAIENFGTPGLPLAILGQAKPQQARFYVAASQNGEAQANGLTKEQAGYSSGKGLRGRKVYPHHNAQPNGHWGNAMQDRTQQAVNGHFQEYRRPDSEKARDNQNRSIQGWVKPGTEFTFDIHVTNLSKVELGALLWLLSLPDNHYHRFGGGKPLGFGSVRLEIDAAKTHFYDGKEWKRIYSTFDEVPTTEADQAEIVQAFQDAVRTSFGSPASFDDVSFIAAWLKMATGHEDTLPTHYPRITTHPDPAGENFRWFTGNESGQRVCLGNLTNDTGLPLPNPGQGGN